MSLGVVYLYYLYVKRWTHLNVDFPIDCALCCLKHLPSSADSLGHLIFSAFQICQSWYVPEVFPQKFS